MAAAAFLTERYDVAVWRTAAGDSAKVATDDFLSKSDLRRLLKFSRGRSRKSAAMRRSGARFGSTRRSSASGGTILGCASIACTAWSSWSIRERLGIGTLHLRSQLIERAELKLLHCPLGASKLLRNFMDAPLLHKTLPDDAALIGGQPVHEAEEPGALFDFLKVYSRTNFGRIVEAGQLSRGALRPVGDRIGRDPEEPGGERNAAPFEAP